MHHFGNLQKITKYAQKISEEIWAKLGLSVRILVENRLHMQIE